MNLKGGGGGNFVPSHVFKLLHTKEIVQIVCIGRIGELC